MKEHEEFGHDLFMAQRIIERLRAEKLELEAKLEYMEETLCICEDKAHIMQHEFNLTKKNLERKREELRNKSALLRLQNRILKESGLN